MFIKYNSIINVSRHIKDIHMISPPTSPSKNLQGASRTTGGFSRGRTLGNTFNIADASDYQMDLDLTLSLPGKVYIYDSRSHLADLDPITVKPSHILKTDVSRTLAPVLTKLARKYSPVCSMFNSSVFLSFANHLLESSMRIHTYEQNEWTIKGKYDTAVEDDDEIFWMKINKDHVLPMWLVSVLILF